MFSRLHPLASTLLARAVDERHPAPLSRLPTVRLQALSRCRIRPAGRASDRGRSASGSSIKEALAMIG